MDKLLQGIQQFQRGPFQDKRKLFESLDTGQSPATLFITCSDSRIVPNLITHTDPGDLFVLRNAGNLVPHYEQGLGEAATIEYAVSVLKVTDVVVCGHSQCGAMKGLIDPASCSELSAVSQWVSRAQYVLQSVSDQFTDLSPGELLDRVIKANVLAQVENLKSHPAVRMAMENEGLRLHGWVYSIGTGEVEGYSPANGNFVSVVDATQAANQA